MELKNYLRGLGLGIVVTALIMGFSLSGKQTMTDEKIISIQPVLSAHYISDKDYTVLVPFQPEQDGVYKIKRKKISGDHELRIYNSDFSMLYEKYFYDMSFELTAGALYYISITHYYNETEQSESYLQIYREE